MTLTIVKSAKVVLRRTDVRHVMVVASALRQRDDVVAGYSVGVEHGTPRQDIRMVGDVFAVIPFDDGDRRVMFSRDNAHRNIGEQITHDGTMP